MSQANNTTKRKERKHLTQAEHQRIERMLKAGANKTQIAKALFRDKSTIKREIKRGQATQRHRVKYESKDPNYSEYTYTTEYYAETGQICYENNRANCGRRCKLVESKNLVSFIEKKVLGKESKYGIYINVVK